MGGPDIPELLASVRDIILKAKTAGTLDTMTPRMVRSELEGLFSLEQGFLDEGMYRKPIKSAIDKAVEEAVAPESPPPTRKKAIKKRKLEDVVEDVEEPPEKSKRAQAKEKVAAKPSKGKEEHEKFKSPAEAPESGSEGQASASPRPSAKRGGASSKKPRSPSPEKEVEEGGVPADVKGGTKDASDSDMSVLIDEPPKPKRVKKEKAPIKSKKGTQKKPSTSKLSKDEETIKRLKSLVVACGVRKVWSKVFQDTDQPPGQIRKLKEILTDLGMSGRMSIEQAKTIRERRELAQEMEDVQSFEKAVVGRPTRGAKSGPAETMDKSASEPESDASEDVPRAKRKGTAHRSIMNFLGDQSDED